MAIYVSHTLSMLITTLLFWVRQAAAGAHIYTNTNNVQGQIPAPKISTAAIHYLGTVGTAIACENKCTQLPSCTSFTWHRTNFSAAEWAGQCYGRVDGIWNIIHQEDIDSGRLRSFHCNDDFDCSYNGKCTDGKCVCAPQWRGTYCQRLNLLPARKYSGKMDFDNKTGANISSWGG